MGVISKMVETKAKVAGAAKESVTELKSRLFESASRALDTEFKKYDNLRSMLESSNQVDRDRAALTVEKMYSQRRYIENAKMTMTEATITAGFQNLIPKLLDLVARPFKFHFA